MYQPIDQVKTGMKLKKILKAAGYSVKDIQELLVLQGRSAASGIVDAEAKSRFKRLTAYAEYFRMAS